MKRVLMVAYHFPPLAGSSGVQRTLRFVQQLPRYGWQPIVLSAHPRAYERSSDDLMAEIPVGTTVRRAFAVDAARHLSLGGRYIGAMSRPDRWISWKYDGMRQGMKLIREFKAQAIWSTFPIATAHVIAAGLHERSALPWIADFRDPMAQEGYPSDPRTHAQYREIEHRTLAQASASLFTAPGAAAMYRERYPTLGDRFAVLENGYDEESFLAAERAGKAFEPLNAGALTLLHSGIVYPSERDPSALFDALQRLARSGELNSGRLKLRFRGAVHDAMLDRLARERGVREFVEIVPPLAYEEALREMLSADGLLVMQASNCNQQIPAKVYEYLRARRPVICLSDPVGDTAQMLSAAGVRDIASLESADAIAALLPAFLARLREGRAELPEPAAVHRASREQRTKSLAARLDCLC